VRLDPLGGVARPAAPPPPPTERVQVPVDGTLKEVLLAEQLPVEASITSVSQVTLMYPPPPLDP
jgi:hypothetical protein